MAITTTRSIRMMIRLFKNLNLAPSPDRFEPNFDFVIEIFLNDVFANRASHTRVRQRRNRFQTTSLCRRLKDVLVVFPHFVFCWTNRLPEFQFKEFLASDATAYRVEDSGCGNLEDSTLSIRQGATSWIARVRDLRKVALSHLSIDLVFGNLDARIVRK